MHMHMLFKTSVQEESVDVCHRHCLGKGENCKDLLRSEGKSLLKDEHCTSSCFGKGLSVFEKEIKRKCNLENALNDILIRYNASKSELLGQTFQTTQYKLMRIFVTVILTTERFMVILNGVLKPI